MYVLLLFTIQLLLWTNRANALRTYCTTSERMSAEQSNLTCVFPVDVKKEHKTFCLQQLDRSGNYDIVVACTWLDDKLRCNMKDGFSLNSELSYEVGVQVPSNETGARFKCNTVPSPAGTELQECGFPSKTEKIPTTVSETTEKKLSPQELAHNETTKTAFSACSACSGCSPVFLYLFSVCLVVIVALLAFIIGHRKIAGRCSNKPVNDNHPEKSKMFEPV